LYEFIFYDVALRVDKAVIGLIILLYSKTIKFVLQRFFLNKTHFFSRNLYEWVPFGCKISKFVILSLVPIPKLPSDLFFGGICLRKLKILPFLYSIYMEGTLRMSNYRILSIFFRFLDPNIVTKTAVRCVLG
jgi:hypothetical protein